MAVTHVLAVSSRSCFSFHASAIFASLNMQFCKMSFLCLYKLVLKREELQIDHVDVTVEIACDILFMKLAATFGVQPRFNSDHSYTAPLHR